MSQPAGQSQKPLAELRNTPLHELTPNELARLQAADTNGSSSTVFPLKTDSSQPVGSIQWPNDGSFGLIPAGKTVFDLEGGTVTFDNGETDERIGRLSDLGVDAMRSVHMHPYFDSMSVSWESPRTQGPIADWMDNQHHVLTNEEMTKFTIWTELPSAGYAEFGTAPEHPPIVPDGEQNPHTRTDTIDVTSDDWEGFVMRPSKFNPRTRAATTMGRERAQTVGNPLFDAKAVGSIYTREHTILIFNRGANPVDIRIRNANQPPIPGVFTVDDVMIADPSTGESGKKVPGASNGTPGKASFRTQRGSIFLQVQVKNHTKGASSRVSMDYWGITGV